MLYQWELGGGTPPEVAASFWTTHGAETDLSDQGRAFAEALLAGTVAALAAIDPLIQDACEHWRLSRLALIDRLILRIAVYELLHEAETPAPVVIDEAIELARTFGGDDAVRFVNGVLDGIRKKLEADEP